MSEYDETGKFITVTNVNYLQETIKSLRKKTVSYIIVCSKQKLQDFKDWKIITQQKFDDNNYLVLIKKVIYLPYLIFSMFTVLFWILQKIIIDGNSIFIKPTNDDYDLSIWTCIQKHNSSKGIICIISNNEPLEGVSTYVGDVLRKYKSEKLLR